MVPSIYRAHLLPRATVTVRAILGLTPHSPTHRSRPKGTVVRAILGLTPHPHTHPPTHRSRPKGKHSAE